MEDRSSVTLMNSIPFRRSIFLATARVIVENPSGEKSSVRTLLDHATESSFTSERVAQLLRVKRNRVSLSITGFQGISTGEAKFVTQVRLRSPQSDSFSIPMTALILTNLSSLLPSDRVPLQH